MKIDVGEAFTECFLTIFLNRKIKPFEIMHKVQIHILFSVIDCNRGVPLFASLF